MHNRVRNLGLLSLTGMLALGLVTLVWAIAPDSSAAQQNAMHNCPQASRWAISVWAGADGTDTGQALDTCGTGSVAAAYSLDPQTGRWSHWFAGQPKVTTLSTLDNMQGVIALGAAGHEAEIALSEKERVVSPDATEAELAELVTGGNTFAFDLYENVREGKDNLFYSPYSIYLALAMTYAGARGVTMQQMADTLHFTLPEDRLHPAFNALDLTLAQRGEGAEGEDGEGFRLNIVNAIWGQKGYAFLPEFLDVLAENYGAGLRLLDFMNAPEESRLTINDWVSNETEGRIEDLLPPGLINPLTRLVLTNAIYFNAAWSAPFEPDLTDEGTFYLLDGSEVAVPMMKQTAGFGYAEADTYQAVELPYDGHELSMVILLPAPGQFEAVEDWMTAQQLDSIVNDLATQNVALTMPKFRFESDLGLRDALVAMGMPLAFSQEDADFSGMTGAEDLFIKDVIHKAFISVDEAGTEAAAATAVVLPPTAAPPEPVEVTVDRPFVFLIRDIETDIVLFIGRVVNPS